MRVHRSTSSRPAPAPGARTLAVLVAALLGAAPTLGGPDVPVAPGPRVQDGADPQVRTRRRRGPDRSIYPDAPEGRPAPLEVPDAAPGPDGELRPYTEPIPGSDASLELVPIPGGVFTLGSPPTERGRRPDEGPQVQVRLEPFWMGRTEVTWDAYHVFMLRLDREQRDDDLPAIPQDAWADAVTRPTPPYVPMDFSMGVEGFPAICMTQHAAKTFTRWLSMKTGRFYRLPTEAEWEYACRAGSATAYSFGDDPGALGDHAWYFENSDERYHRVGQKRPNAFGLHDMHGNVSEWVLDRHDEGFYAALRSGGEEPVVAPLAWPEALYPRVVRGGSWDDDPDRLRSAARRGSNEGWKVQDPQLPKSIWYHTDARWVGFRVVRPLVEPPPEEQARYWDADTEAVRKIEARQRTGGR